MISKTYNLLKDFMKIFLTFLMVISSFGLQARIEAVDSIDVDMRLELREMTMDGHRPSSNYKQARKDIFQNIHLEKDSDGYFVKDVYCNKIIRTRIGPRDMPSASIVNIEHTWPKSKFNGRENYNHQQADLHILYPTDSRANSSRSSFQFFDFKEGTRGLPDCGSSIKEYVSGRRTYGFEPPSEHKGNVARALFYFSLRYQSHISDGEEEILRKWNEMDPPDEAELRRNDLIEDIQGNRNPFIDDHDFADFIDNF